MRLELLTALNVGITVLWDAVRSSGSAYFSNMKMETLGFFETLMILVETSTSVALLSPAESCFC
jgi:hypothetical protein